MCKTAPVISKVWKTEKVFELAIERNGIDFIPGDSVALYTKDGTESRPYSIVSGFREPVLRFLIQRIPNGHVSDYLSSLEPGDTTMFSAPFGWFHPAEGIKDAPFVFIATGTGIAPFLSFLCAHPDNPPKMCLYGVRHYEDTIDLAFLQESCPLALTISQNKREPYLHGRVTDHINKIQHEPNMHYYLCGLDSMIDDVTKILEETGVDFTRIHREVFFNVSP